MCSAGWGDVFSFWANVFNFRPNVFSFEGDVFSEGRGEGRGKRSESGEEGRGTKTGSGSFGRLREGSPRDSGPGHYERGGRGQEGTHEGRLAWRQEGTHKGRPYMEKTAGDAGMTGMCPRCRANVSSSGPDVSSFGPDVSTFWRNVSSFGGNVSTVAGEVSNFRRRALVGGRAREAGVAGSAMPRWAGTGGGRMLDGAGGWVAWWCYRRSQSQAALGTAPGPPHSRGTGQGWGYTGSAGIGGRGGVEQGWAVALAEEIAVDLAHSGLYWVDECERTSYAWA